MALHLDPAPAAALEALAAVMPPGPHPDARQRAPAQLCTARPIPLYSPSLRALAAGGTGALAKARRTGWRFLVLDGGQALVVDIPEGRGGPRVVRGGRIAERLKRAALAAERIAASASSYEIRVLDVHPIGEPVLWLRSRDDGKTDRFISLGRAARPLSEARLLRSLRRAATDRLRRSAPTERLPTPDSRAG